MAKGIKKMTDLAPFIVALIVMLVGLAGILVPGLPDLIFVFLGALIYSIWTGFEKTNLIFIIIFLALTLFGLLFDWLGAILGAKSGKADFMGILGAIVGAIVGIFIGGLVGIIGGAFIGTILFEMIFSHKTIASFICKTSFYTNNIWILV